MLILGWQYKYSLIRQFWAHWDWPSSWQRAGWSGVYYLSKAQWKHLTFLSLCTFLIKKGRMKWDPGDAAIWRTQAGRAWTQSTCVRSELDRVEHDIDRGVPSAVQGRLEKHHRDTALGQLHWQRATSTWKMRRIAVRSTANSNTGNDKWGNWISCIMIEISSFG